MKTIYLLDHRLKWKTFKKLQGKKEIKRNWCWNGHYWHSKCRIKDFEALGE